MSLALETVKKLNDYKKARGLKGEDFNIRINYLIQKINWKDIRLIFEFHRNNSDLTPFITFLYKPNDLSLLNLAYTERKKIIDYYIDEFDYVERMKLGRILNPLLRSMDKADYISYLLKIKRKNEQCL